MRWLALTAVLVLAGCDREIQREYDPAAYVEQRDISCSYSCFTCGLDFAGNFSCGIDSCSGRQPAQVRVHEYTAWWQSERITREEDTMVLEVLSPCQ